MRKWLGHISKVIHFTLICYRRPLLTYEVAYFVNLHPIFPFLNREQFERQAFDPDLLESLETNPSFSALYHAILALGSQYYRGGSFEPGSGIAWELFQVSLGHVSEIIVPKESIENVQVLHSGARNSSYAMK
jgi:hypothetical protein